MKDHEIREFVNELTEVAEQYGQTQQLRERIRGVVFKAIPPSFLSTETEELKKSMKEGFEAQRKAGINVDWFTWQIAWQDCVAVKESGE